MEMNTRAIFVLAAGLTASPAVFAAGTPTDLHFGHDVPTTQMSTDASLTEMTVMEPAVTESRASVPPVTEADRKATSGNLEGHAVHDGAVNYLALLDQLEQQRSDNRNSFNWSVNSWVGGDIDRLWIKSEDERNGGEMGTAEAQFL